MKFSQKGFNPEYAEEAPSLEQLSKLKGDTVLEFGTPWCTHCQAATPDIREVLTEHAELPHIKLFDGKGKPLGRAFKVKLWPTLILLREGKEVNRVVRPSSASEIREFIHS